MQLMSYIQALDPQQKAALDSVCEIYNAYRIEAAATDVAYQQMLSTTKEFKQRRDLAQDNFQVVRERMDACLRSAIAVARANISGRSGGPSPIISGNS
jgi:hypothetical protein